MASGSIPIATFGANPDTAKAIQARLVPEYDVVHVSLTLETALSELPFLAAGHLEVPCASNIGSNAFRDAAQRRIPKAVTFGGGIPDEQVAAVMGAIREQLVAAGKSGDEVKPVRVTREEILATGATGPSPEAIVQVLRGKLAGLVQEGEI